MGERRKFLAPEFKSWREFLEFIGRQTICEAHPDACEPRKIKHVVWDADGTIWDIEPVSVATLCESPFKRKDDAVVGKLKFHVHLFPKELERLAEGECKIRLKPELRETLKELEEMGITSSIVSINSPESVEEIVKAFDLKREFIDIKANLLNDKWWLMEKLFEEHNIKPSEVLYVDDDAGNLWDAFRFHKVLPVEMGRDVLSPKEILRYIER